MTKAKQKVAESAKKDNRLAVMVCPKKHAKFVLKLQELEALRLTTTNQFILSKHQVGFTSPEDFCNTEFEIVSLRLARMIRELKRDIAKEKKKTLGSAGSPVNGE